MTAFDLRLLASAAVAACHLLLPATALAFSARSTRPAAGCDRRRALLAAAALAPFPRPAAARAPGSTDVAEAALQIVDASRALRGLRDAWSQYAVIDAEGRAGGTDGARRILGGIAPQAGSAAIAAARATPLYRLDVAFVAVRRGALEGGDGWAERLDLERFEDLAERVVYGVQKADGNFYGVLFAQKGTSMIEAIFAETKSLVDQGIVDLDEMIGLLKDAGAPGVI